MQQGFNALLEPPRRVAPVEVVLDVPPALQLDDAVPDSEQVAGRDLADATEHRAARQAPLEREVVAERVTVRLDAREERQKRFRLRREVHELPDARVQQRLDSQPVTR